MKAGRIGFWAHVALLFLVRSGRSTASLSVMVMVAVASLIFLSALAVGVNDAMLRNTVGLFSGHIAGYGLPASMAPEELRVEGVAGVLKRVFLPGVLSWGNLDIPVTLCGVDPGSEIGLTSLPRKIVTGSYPQHGHAELMLGQPLAADLGVKRGEVLAFASPPGGGSLRLTLSGTYRTGIDQLDRGIAFCPLDVLPERGSSWSAAVFLRCGTDALKIVDAYRERGLGAYRFETWETMLPDLRQLIDLEVVSMGIVIILVFGVVSLGIACSFVIFIIKNMREYGIMKAMGVTVGEMSLLIALKVVMMNVMACAAGLLIGVLCVWAVARSGGIDMSAFTSHNRYFSVSGVVTPRLTVFSLMAPPTAAVLFSLTAAIWPAVLVARRKAAEILRMM